MPRSRKQDLTFYLLKTEAPAFEACLSKPEELIRYALPPESGLNGCLYTRAPHFRDPWWLRFVRTALPGLPDMHNASTAAVCFLTVDAAFLPSANCGEKECAYNQRAAATNGLFLFDSKLVRPSGALTDIEFCDLVTSDKQLVHVKRKNRSSTLSHLFAQGLQSAEIFYSDAVFLQRLKAKALAEISPEAAAAIPDVKPAPHEWQIVFAIILEGDRAWPGSLPFFSQLNFRNTAERLSRMGYKVGLARVPLDEEAAEARRAAIPLHLEV